jgi:regulator of protease activity HflC (stomatin/prohibitin superfamily)
MKKVILLTALPLAISLSSCWDFNRRQEFLDAENKGKSTLIEAESSKKAMIETAKAENESATLQAEAKVKIAKAEAQAEIERAYGVAKANEIIGNSLKGNNEYLKYLMIQGLNDSKGERIYIPTEAGLPILEAKN